MENLYILYVFIFFTFILNVANFFFTYKKLTKREIVLYTYLLLSILGWFIANAGADLIKDPFWAVFFARLGIIFPLNTLNAVFQITKVFPQSLQKPLLKSTFSFVNILTLFLTLAILVFVNTPFNIINIEILSDSPILYEPGLFYFLVSSISFFVFVPIIIMSWLGGFKEYTKIQKKQVIVLLATYIIVAVSVALGLVFLPLQGLSQYAPTMFLSLGLLLFIINQNLLIKGFMPNVFYDLGVLVWGVLSSGVATVFIFTVTQYQGSLNFFSIFLLTLMLLAALLWSYKRVVAFLRKDYHGVEDEVLKFARRTTVILDKEKIIEELYYTLKVVFPKGDCKVVLEKSNGSKLYGDLKKWWASFSQPLITTQEVLIEQFLLEKVEETLTKELYSTFREKNIELVIPLNIGGELGGVILLKNLVRVLGVKEYELLGLLAENASVSISRSLLYEEVEEFSKGLQGKVDEQTKELRIRMENMEEMRQRERDLLDIMGHELRTPLTIAKNSMELIDIYKQNKKKEKQEIKWDSNFQKQFDYIKAAIRREMAIVETLLSATKLDAKKVEPHFTEVNLVKVIKTSLLGFEKEAIRKGLVVKVDINTKKKWVVKADSLQIQQVADNLVSNAVKYTHKGCIKISLKDLGKKVSIVVSDTGEGIEKKSIKSLGQKFYRLNQYIDSNGKGGKREGLVRPGGTGLGLYVAFGLVKIMGGSYDVESRVGKGSVFTVTFNKV